MATIVTSYIGADAAATYPDAAAAGRCFITIDAWKASIPTDLVTAGVRHIGKLRNQRFGSTGTVLSLGSSFVCNADCYIELTADDNCSIWDFGPAPVRYTESGARLETTGVGSFLLNIQCSFFKLSRLQLNATDTGTGSAPLLYASATKVDVNRCLFEGSVNSTSYPGIVHLSSSSSANAHVIRNSVIITKTTNASSIIAKLATASSAYNCTFVSLGTTLTYGIATQYAAGTIKNCYVGGVGTSAENGVSAFNRINSYCNVAAQGYTAAAMADCFEGVTVGSHDLRLKAGSPLINAGAAEATYADTSLNGVLRATAGSAYDVGAWEYAAPSAAPTFSGTIGNISATQGTASTTPTASYFSDPGDTLTYSLVGSIPSGVTINASTGVITVAASTAVGSYSNIAVRATDAGGLAADSTTFTITVSNATPQFIGPINPISAVSGSAINVNVASAFSDSDALTFSASPAGAAWPSGLSISSSGVISGSITATGTTTGLKVRATDTGGLTVDSAAFNVTINAAGTPVGFVGGPVPAQAPLVGTAFNLALAGFFSGSQTPFVYSVLSGALPPGLTLNSSTGVISGTPTLAGGFNATIRVTDASNVTADTGSISFAVAAPVAFQGNITPKGGTAGTAFSLDVSSYFVGTRTPFTYAISGTSGLSVSSSGVVSGTLPAAGAYTFTVTATDTAGTSSSSNAVALTTSDASDLPKIVTPVMVNNTGKRTGVLARVSGWTVSVYDAATGDLVLRKTGLTTDDQGVLTIADARMTKGVTYCYEPSHPTLGRRLPKGMAV